jgi:multidrug transporter EmrE-like cation transporter
MVSLQSLPLITVPQSWPVPVVASLARVSLATLDIVGSIAAKEWAMDRQSRPLMLGVAAFLLLFWVYASALQYAELALVTLGWIVVLQVGLLVVDRLRYGVTIPLDRWVAIVVILAAQGYLLLAPTSQAAG